MNSDQSENGFRNPAPYTQAADAPFREIPQNDANNWNPGAAPPDPAGYGQNAYAAGAPASPQYGAYPPAGNAYPGQPYAPAGGQPYAGSSPYAGNPAAAGGYGGRPPYAQPQQPYGQPGASGYPRQQRPSVNVKAYLGDFDQLLRKLFSGKSTTAFQYDLSLPVWVGLLIVNILIYGLAAATATYRMGLGLVASALNALSSVLGDTAAGSGAGAWGHAFGMALLFQLLLLLLLTASGFVIAFVSGSERRPPLQYLKTVAAATIPHSLIALLLLLISFLSAGFALSLLQMLPYLLLFVFSVAFDIVHPSKRQSHFWHFVVLMLLIALLSSLI